MIAQLIPTDGGSPITLYRDITIIGRDGDICDLTLSHKSISKLHSVLVKSDGLLFVRDLGSTNGTKVNGQKITRGALLPGDLLSFANAKFKIFLGPGEPDPPKGQLTESIPTPSKKLLAQKASKEVKGSKPAPELLESKSDVRLLNADELKELESQP